MKASANKERRKYIRHPVQIPIVCRRKEHLEPHQAELHDIGCGGMAFVSTLAFEPGDVISVDYPTLDVRGLAGEITWSEMLDDGTHRHRYGLRFLDSTVFLRARQVEQLCRMEIYRRAQRDEHGRQLSPGDAAMEWIEKTAAHFPH